MWIAASCDPIVGINRTANRLATIHSHILSIGAWHSQGEAYIAVCKVHHACQKVCKFLVKVVFAFWGRRPRRGMCHFSILSAWSDRWRRDPSSIFCKIADTGTFRKSFLSTNKLNPLVNQNFITNEISGSRWTGSNWFSLCTYKNASWNATVYKLYKMDYKINVTIRFEFVNVFFL